MEKISVAILVGSDSDLTVINESAKILEKFAVAFSINIASAHRTAEHLKNSIKSAETKGAKVFIAGAGMSAALPGVVASETLLPVIGVPLEGKHLASQDALFSITQMPGGIPVAAMSIGKAGAINAALLAVSILALNDKDLALKLQKYRADMAESILGKDAALQAQGIEKYLENNKK
jgi:5-(carboxyamino)imidazole ribonucleotide mutase